MWLQLINLLQHFTQKCRLKAWDEGENFIDVDPILLHAPIGNELCLVFNNIINILV